MWARLGRGIVERDHEIGLRGSPQAALDGGPRLEIVRERYGAEIPAEWCADLGGGREHRRHAGLHSYIQRTPSGIAGLDSLEDRRRHGEHAWIAARHHDNLAAGRGQRQRMPRALELGAIV